MSTLLETKQSAIPHLEPESVIGKSYGDAKSILEGAGYTVKTALSNPRKVISWRYMKDYDPLTMNLVVEKNIVIDAFKG